MPAQGFIPADQYTVPKGLTTASTPQGGSAYADLGGVYGAKGALYLKGANGYTLAPQTLPAQQGTVPNVTTQTANPDGSTTNTTGTQVSAQNAGNVQVQPAGATPTFDPMSQQGQALSKALEDAANGVGNALGGVPSKATPKMDASGNALNADGTPVVTHENFSLADTLAKIQAPTPPNAATVQANAENTAGIPAIQQNISTLTQQYNDLQNNLQNEQAQEASKPGVVATIINGRMRMLSAEQSKALNDLKSQITAAHTQFTQANQAVKAIMANTQTDYKNAEAQYEFQYNKALAQYQDETNNENKSETTAKANAQVIINSYKGSSTGFNSITPEQKTQWENLELQAGMPSGTIEAAVKAELNVTKFVKGKDGMYITGTDDSGTPFTAKVVGSSGVGTGGKGGTPTQQAAQKLKEDTNKMSSALDSAKGTDGMVSNEDWNQALKDWLSADTSHTTSQFITAFKSYKSTNK